MISYSLSSTPRLVWLTASAIAGLIGWLSGAPVALVLGCLAVLWLPVLAAYMPHQWSKESQSFQVLGWTIVAVAGLAASGGVRSPLTILFALGPLTGLALSNHRIALESAVFSALAFICFWVMNFWKGWPPVPENLIVFTSALALAAIIYAGVLSASTIMNLRRRIQGEFADKASVRDRAPAADLRGGVHLPADFPCAVLSISSQGRIRAIEGDRSLLGNVCVGDVASDALLAHHSSLDPAFLGSDSERVVPWPAGGEVSLRAIQMETGSLLLISPVSPDDQAREALQERTQFFASLGHDLKTPLNAIIGFADMMRSEIRGELPDAYKEYSEIIRESGQEMLLMVEDILDLAKADAKKLRLEFEPVDLAASGVSVMRQLEAQAQRAGVLLSLQAEDDVWAEADARAVRQVWQNLVSNAIKYSRKGDPVRLQVGQSDDAVFLAVEDFGAGMDEEDLDRIGKPFSQGENASGRMGTGLGLAVVKQFADLHGGQVKVETAKDQGTRVEVTFRRAQMTEFEGIDKAAQ